MSKRSPYTGILSEPMEIKVPAGLDPAKVPEFYLALGISAKTWKRMLTALRFKELESLMARKQALFHHFELDPASPGSDLDLALCLAYRHERATLIKGDRVSFEAICDLCETADPVGVVWKLAFKHVPGFQACEPKYRRRLATNDWVKIFITIASVWDRLGPKASDHGIVDVMLDPQRLREFVPQKAAESVQSILAKSGNKDRGSPRDLASRESFLRTAIRESRNAWADVKSGKATHFQLQFVCEVVPALQSLKD
jgi:hypothetical protein